jgi:Transcriptional regulator, AbiEi antitoxin
VNNIVRCDDTVALQRGVLSRPQAISLGLTDSAIAARLRKGRWQRLHPGVYATFSGDPARQALLWAAVLRAGPAAVLSHQTAAELHSLTSDPAPAIHVLVPSGSQIAPITGVALHYSRRVNEARHPVLLPPRTRIEEAVLDLAAAASSLDPALGWIFHACGSRRTTPGKISAAMLLRPRMRWRSELSDALSLATNGVHSLLEFRYVNRVERPHGLPPGKRQHAVRRAGRRQYQDVDYDSCDVVVELDGQAAHPEGLRWGDIRRDNANAAEGLLTLRYGWADVTERPCLVAGEIGATLGRRGWDGVLRRCGRLCPLPE